MGLLRGIRDLWRQYRAFGDRELESLRQQVLRNRETLLKVKAIQESNQTLAEAAVLNAIKETVDEMQTIREQAAAESTAARRALKQLEQKVERELAANEKLATVELLKNVDVAKLMNLENARVAEDTQSPEKKIETEGNTERGTNAT